MAPKNQTRRAVGLTALHEMVSSFAPPPATRHFAVGTVRREIEGNGGLEILIPMRRAPDSIPGHLEYALKQECLDLRVWRSVLEWIDPEIIQKWVEQSPTSKYARIAWFLYEWLTLRTLALPNATVGNFVPIADDSLQFVTGSASRIPRQRVINNLLGDEEFCPLVRKSRKLLAWLNSDLPVRAQRVVESVDPRDLQRATDYLYRKETKASFLIEREEVSPTREDRFMSALQRAASTRAYQESDLVALQNEIVDPRYAEPAYRTKQVYVGQTLPSGAERVHYPCPRPADVRRMMYGWERCLTHTEKLHPVIQAAILGFGLVFIHPFEDGNGRLHRFVIHATLARRKFAPPNLVIPVSATMLRNRQAYDQALDAHSKAISPFVSFQLSEDGEMTVDNDTRDLYRFWDATPQCEYLFEALDEAIRIDLPDELRVLRAYDAGLRALLSVVDMPDRRANRLLRLIIQNDYRLAKRRRDEFGELSDDELKEIEEAVWSAAHTDDSQPEGPSERPSAPTQ